MTGEQCQRHTEPRRFGPDRLAGRTDTRPSIDKGKNVLLAVLAPPSSFSDWAVPALRALIELCVGPLDFINLTTIEQFRADWDNRSEANLMMVSGCLDPEIAQVLGNGSMPAILLRASPHAVLNHELGRPEQTLMSAARSTSVSFASLHDVAVTSRSMTIISQDDRPDQILRLIADALSIGATEDQIAAVIQNTGLPHNPSVMDRVSRTSPEIEAILQSLEPFASIYERKSTGHFIWMPPLFLGVDANGVPTNEALQKIELEGPARILLYGPYLHLPPGEWTLNAQFEVSNNFSGNMIFAEAMLGATVSSTGLWPLPGRGRYEFTLPIAVTDPKEPVELRMAITEGAIEGDVELERVDVRRRAPTN